MTRSRHWIMPACCCDLERSFRQFLASDVAQIRHVGSNITIERSEGTSFNSRGDAPSGARFGARADGGYTDGGRVRVGERGPEDVDLPAGAYALEAWHEKYGVQTQKVTMTDQNQEISFAFKA